MVVFINSKIGKWKNYQEWDIVIRFIYKVRAYRIVSNKKVYRSYSSVKYIKNLSR